jgi:hypothetical protein
MALFLTLVPFAYTVTSVDDLRKSQRFNLKLPMTLLRCGGQTVEQPSETSNISSNGILFRSGIAMKIGSPIEYVLTLAAGAGVANAVRLHCLGKIVRHAEPEAVAATIERYQFERVTS